MPNAAEHGGLIQVASIQPQHRKSEIVERSDILFINAELADPQEWRLLLTLPKSVPIIVETPGNYLASARQAVAFAIDGQKCIWIYLAGADQYWADRLKQFERIFEGDGR